MLIRIDEPTSRRGQAARPRWAPFALGFRPFYLLAALFGSLAVLLWAASFPGWVRLPAIGVAWHAHEMVFGFVVAVIVGFLFTAGRNWTGLATPTGPALAALCALWLGGRGAMLLGGSGNVWVALVDLAFLPVVALVLARLLWRRGQGRNAFIPLLILALALANGVFHLRALGVVDGSPLTAIHAALLLVTLLETVIGGRVVPGFTASALRGVRQWRPLWLERAVIVSTLLASLAWLLLPETLDALVTGLLLLAAGLQGLRALGWNPLAVWRHPLLWVLHLAYLWIPLGLALLAAARNGWVPLSAAIHALAIGATGGLIIGMITRTALGHTGRLLRVGRIEVLAYSLVLLAALIRVGTLLWWPAAAAMGIALAALCWSGAFALYAVRYAPWLLRPRVDGQPG